MREVQLTALEARFKDDTLRLYGKVENQTDEVASSIALSWHASRGVQTLQDGAVQVPGSSANASVQRITEVLQPGEVREFDIPLALAGSLSSPQVVFSRIGLGFNGVSRAYGDVVCDLPEAVTIEMAADVSGEVSETSLAVATITVRNTGRSASKQGALSFELPDDVALFHDLARGEFVCEVPSLPAGDAFTTKVAFCLRAATAAGVRQIRTSLVIDEADTASFEFPVSLRVAPRVSIRVYPAAGGWRAGEWREVDVAISNSGSALASGVELIAAPIGGVIIDASRERYSVSPMLENGHRVLRVAVGDVAPGEVARVAIRAQAPFMRIAEDPSLTLVARHGEQEATAAIDVDLEYVAAFDAARTEIVSPASALPAGTVARIPLKIANSGSAAAENVRLELAHHPNLVILGVEDTRSQVRGGVYYAGSIPAGYVHENALLVRIGAVYAGAEAFDVRGVLFADNTFGVALEPAIIETTGEVALALETASDEPGHVRVLVRSIGDAIAKHLQLRCALSDGAAIIERSTRVDGMLIPDEDGKSVLVGSGLSARDVVPGASIPLTFQVEAASANAIEATFTALADGEEAVSASLSLVPLVQAEAPKYSGTGFVLDHHAVTDAVALPVAQGDDHAVQPALSDPSRSDDAAVLPATPTPERVADTQAAVLPLPESDATGVALVGTAAKQTQEPAANAGLPSFDNLVLERPPLSTERPLAAVATTEGQSAKVEVRKVEGNDLAAEKQPQAQEPIVDAQPIALTQTTHNEQLSTPITQAPTAGVEPVAPVESKTTEAAARAAGIVLRLAPATLPLTSAWVRGVVTTLSPLIRSNARELSMHAMALRFFLPKQFEAAVQAERQGEIDEALAALHGAFRRDTVMAAGMAESASFAPSESWLARVETPQLAGAARAFTRSLESVQFTRESEFAPSGGELVAHVDYANVAGIERRFNTGDALSTTWVFAQMFPTVCSDSPVLTEALERYRKALEAVLWDVPANEGLRYAVPVDLDDLLTNLHDALRGYASAMGVSVAA